PYFQQLALKGHGIRLGDGLPTADGERLVHIGEAFKGTVINELVAGHFADSSQHTRIGNALLAEGFHQLAPHALVAKIIRSHGSAAKLDAWVERWDFVVPSAISRRGS